MEITSYRCDGPGCKAVKQDTNHWWKIYILDRDRSNVFAGLIILPWDIASVTQLDTGSLALPEKPELHLCGEQCLIRMLSELLSKGGTIEKVKAESGTTSTA